MKDQRDETLLVLLTAPGPGGISVVLFSGPRAAEIAACAFRPKRARSVRGLPEGALVYGHVVRHGELLDEAILARVGTPGDGDAFEINCHGGIIAAERVRKFLAELGAREMSWRDWLERFGPGGAVERDAIRAMIEAPTAAAARSLAAVARGRLTRRLATIAASLRRAALKSDPVRTTTLTRVVRLARALLTTRPWAKRLTSGVRIVIAGAPNAGKSTLLNALAGRDVALVDPEPGTTRDPVAFDRAIAGAAVTIVDTAGVRDAHSRVEQESVRRAARAVDEADAVIVLVDVTRCPGASQEVLARTSGRPRVVALNKIDLATREEAARVAHALRQQDAVPVSALTGEGVAELLQCLEKRTGLPVSAPRGVILTDARAEAALSELVDRLGSDRAGERPDHGLLESIACRLEEVAPPRADATR